MSIQFTCTCGAKLQAVESDAGKLNSCPTCGAVVTVPANPVVNVTAIPVVAKIAPSGPPRLPPGTIEDRLAKLERQCRVWKGVTAGTAAVATILFILHFSTKPISTPPSKTVAPNAQVTPNAKAMSIDYLTVKGLRVVDDKGQDRVRLEYDDKIGANVVIRSPATREEIRLVAGTEFGTRLLFSSDKGTTSLEDGNLVLRSKNLQTLVHVGLTDEGNGRIALSNNAGKRQVSIFSNDDGGRLDLFDKADNLTASLATMKEQGGGLLLSNKPANQDFWASPNLVALSRGEGKPFVSMGIFDDGGGLIINGKSENEHLELSSSQIGMYDGNGKPTVGIGTADGGGGNLSVFNALGSSVGSLQSNKSNDGALYLTDSTGTQKKVIVPEN